MAENVKHQTRVSISEAVEKQKLSYTLPLHTTIVGRNSAVPMYTPYDQAIAPLNKHPARVYKGTGTRLCLVCKGVYPCIYM